MAGGGNVWSGSYNPSCSVFGNSYVPDSAWANHQRAYQYTGGHSETYNGTTIANIDSDCGDFTLASGSGGGGTRGASQTVSQPNGTVDVFFTGTNGALYHAWYNSGSSWTTAAPMAGTAPLASEPSAVTSSPGVVDVFWKGSDNNLWHVFYIPGHAWTSPAQELGDGPLGGAPKAVAQSDGSIRVFWRGNDNNLWDASYTASGGWTGPNELTSNQNMASDPAPVNSKQGTWDIFWKGSDRHLWHVLAIGISGMFSRTRGPAGLSQTWEMASWEERRLRPGSPMVRSMSSGLVGIALSGMPGMVRAVPGPVPRAWAAASCRARVALPHTA